MDQNLIAILMFSTMMLMLMTGQRVFGAIGFVAVMAAMFLWGTGGSDLGFSAAGNILELDRLETEVDLGQFVHAVAVNAGIQRI